MKKCSSIVWKFFDRLPDENDRCVGVLCKLCNSQYKFFGNTTNLRVHMIKRHPIQWEMGQNGNFDEAFHVDDSSNQAIISLGRKRVFKKEKHVRYSLSVNKAGDNETPGQENMPVIEIQRVDVLDDNTDVEYNEDDEATINMVREMHAQDSDEEWLDESFVQRSEKRKVKTKKIKREIVSPTPKRRASAYYVRSPLKYEHFDTTTSEKDENSVFGEYIANKLRRIHNDKTRCNIQQLITTIFWQAEYGMYDNVDSVKRMLLFSVEDQVQDNDNQRTVIVEETHETSQEEINQES